MQSWNFLCLFFVALYSARAVIAKSSSGSVTLINATPYDWELTSSHSYQVDWHWSVTIPAGTCHEQYLKFTKDHHDDGAEAYYTLVNSPTPASFAIKARTPKHIEVQFQDTLSSVNNPENSIINLGWVENGAVSFVLSGNGDGPYISSNPPVAWMQSTLSSIGSKSLRQIAMPASHDSGMNRVTLSWGGRTHNTVTQTQNTFKQLINGARSFDIRPVFFHGKFYTGHFSAFGSWMVGGTGRTLTDIVKDINSFNAQYPGELIILDISHQMNANKKFREFTPIMWIKLYQELNKIEDLWDPSTLDIPDDLSKLPISSFITTGSKSAVLIRLPNGAPLPGITKRIIGTMTAYAGTASADPGDGMAALGPALQGDDNDNSTATDDGVVNPTPITLSASDNDDISTSDDNHNNTADNDSPTNPSSPSVTIPPILTDPPDVNPKVESIPAEATVPTKSPKIAFFHESRLPISGSYADTDEAKCLIADQLAKLSQDRSNPGADMHKSTWTITQHWQHITDVENKKTSITADAVAAHKAMFGNLWGAMSRSTYPNMIEVDDIHNSQLAALCMAINDYFVSPRISIRDSRALAKRSMSGEAGEKSFNASNEGRLREGLPSLQPVLINSILANAALPARPDLVMVDKSVASDPSRMGNPFHA